MGLDDTFTSEEVQRARLFNRGRLALAVGAGATAFTGTFFLPPFSEFPNQPLPSLGYGLAAYSFLEINLSQVFNLFTMFTPCGLRFTSQACAWFFRSFGQGTLEEKKDSRRKNHLSLLDEVIPKIRDPLFQRRMRIYRDLTNKDYEPALKKAVDFMHFEETVRPWLSPVQKIILYGTDFINRLTGHERDAPSHLAHAIECLGRGDKNLAEQSFTTACALDSPQQIQINCLYSYFLELLSRNNNHLTEKTQQQWQKTVELLLADSTTVQQFRRLGSSRNEVVIVSGEGIVQNSFVFKRSPEKEHLEKEYTLTRKLDAIFDGEDTVVQALAFFSKDDLHYCILKRIAGVSFVEHFLTGDSANTLDKVIPFLAQFHDRLHTQRDKLPEGLIKRRDYEKFLRETYVARMHLSDSPAVTQALSYLTQQLNEHQRQPIHGDLHPENILASATQFTIIDPEHMGIASPYLDLAAFLEHDALHLSPGAREKSLRSYYDSLPIHKGSFEQTRLEYLHGALFRMLQVRAALERHVYSKSLEHQQQVQQYYEQRALQIIHDLKTMDKKTTNFGLESLLFTH